ncbi:MAG TPA: Ig-like domain-containing protein, partial [Candidatus Eisenbacteria bacterium]|nr:Ig-like domain-containing protein [Candidatus Eisenbacteria bacterium]
MPQSPMRLLRRAAVAFALVAMATLLSAAAPAPARAAPIRLIATYPANNAERVAPEAELYFVFDQPTAKSGAFSVADLDSIGGPPGGTLLALQSPRWSASGDTVFLKPVQPMTYGHLHGMLVNVIEAPDPQNSATDLPGVNNPIYFTVSPRANLERLGTPGLYESVTLVPERAVPVTIGVRETAGTAAYFNRARYRFYPA